MMFVNRGQVHVTQVGATVGLLASLMWRNNHEVSLTIIGLCTSIVLVQVLPLPIEMLQSLEFRVGQYPGHFLLPMYAVAATMVLSDKALRGWIRQEGPEEADELLDDMQPPEEMQE